MRPAANKVKRNSNNMNEGAKEMKPGLNIIKPKANKMNRAAKTQVWVFATPKAVGSWVSWVKYRRIPRIRVLCRMQGARIYRGTVYAKNLRFGRRGR